MKLLVMSRPVKKESLCTYSQIGNAPLLDCWMGLSALGLIYIKLEMWFANTSTFSLIIAFDKLYENPILFDHSCSNRRSPISIRAAEWCRPSLKSSAELGALLVRAYCKRNSWLLIVFLIPADAAILWKVNF